MATSKYAENKILDHTLGTLAFSSPATVYIALFTGSASANLEAGILSDEVSDVAVDGSTSTNYSREIIEFDPSSGGIASNTSAGISFNQCENENWGTITTIAVMDSATVGSGNVLFYGELTTSKIVNIGDTLQIAGGAIDIQLT